MKASTASGSVPEYTLLAALAGLHLALAVMVAIAGVVLVVGGTQGDSGVRFVTGIWLLCAAVGLLLIAAAATAFRDLCINSWHTRNAIEGIRAARSPNRTA